MTVKVNEATTETKRGGGVIPNNTLADLQAEEYAVGLEIATDKVKYLLNTAYNISAEIDEHDPLQCLYVTGDLKQLIDIACDYINDALDNLDKLNGVLRKYTLNDRA